MSRYFSDLRDAIDESIISLQNYGVEIDTGHWQGVPTKGKPDLVTKELVNLSWVCRMPSDQEALAMEVGPNLPWAEDHFQERVSRVPSNPGQEYQNWPWWRDQDDSAMTALEPYGTVKFTHTYQERFWPKGAGRGPLGTGSVAIAESHYQNRGIRYAYGDLDDVVALLRREPHTRQATFLIFFPEDTGAVHGGRIPCTLHYHFLLRNDKLHMWYAIRSCDAVRHFRDDVYMAVRLCQWVLQELLNGDNDFPEQQLWESVTPGYLHFTAYSFHVHMGDLHLL